MTPPAKKTTDDVQLIFEERAPAVYLHPLDSAREKCMPRFPTPTPRSGYLNDLDHNRGGTLKKTFLFEESLLRLKIRDPHNQCTKFERHPRPDEFYRLLLRYFEGKELSYEQATVIEDMKIPLDVSTDDQLFYGEFLGAATERERGIVRFYTDPSGLMYEINPLSGGVPSYSKGPEFTCAEILEFKLKTKKKGGISIDEVEGLPEYLFERHFKELPAAFQTGRYKIHLFPSNTLAPLGFGTGPNKPNGYFDMVTYYKRGSRGVAIHPPIEKPIEKPRKEHGGVLDFLTDKKSERSSHLQYGPGSKMFTESW